MRERNSQKRMCLWRIQSIFKMRKLGKTTREISKICNCSASTVSVTLNKYRHEDDMVWNAMNCYEKAKYVWDQQKIRARGKKRFLGSIPDVEKQEYIVEKLVHEGWSPEIISYKIREELGKSVSVSTIYRFVKKNGKKLKKHLYEKGKKRKQRVSNRRSRFHQKQGAPKKKYINERPQSVETRKEFGHWEGDLVVGPVRGSGYVVLNVTERKTRKRHFIRMPNRKAATVLSYLIGFFLSLPPGARLSLTLDNGAEFAPSSMHKLERMFPGLKIYYTEPYSPQQKGSNENFNGRLRKTFPKKTDFALVSITELKKETHRQNNRPMKLHRFLSPQEVWENQMKHLVEYNKIAA